MEWLGLLWKAALMRSASKNYTSAYEMQHHQSERNIIRKHCRNWRNSIKHYIAYFNTVNNNIVEKTSRAHKPQERNRNRRLKPKPTRESRHDVTSSSRFRHRGWRVCCNDGAVGRQACIASHRRHRATSLPRPAAARRVATPRRVSYATMGPTRYSDERSRRTPASEHHETEMVKW